MLFVSLILFPFLGVLFVLDGVILRRPGTSLLVSPIFFPFLRVLVVLDGLILRQPASQRPVVFSLLGLPLVLHGVMLRRLHPQGVGMRLQPETNS